MAQHRWLSAFAAVFGLAGVVLAALGAHAIAFADEVARRLWDTALLLHFFHVAGMLGVAALATLYTGRVLPLSGWMMAGGTFLFSGTLYLRAAAVDVFPAFLAPAGGFMLILAWLVLAVGAVASKSR